MRIVLAPAGSRGDFQPLLALAIGLRAAGHDVLLTASPDFGDEARAFEVPFAPVGRDVQVLIRESGFESSPVRGGVALFRLGRALVAELIDAALPLMRGADLIVGAGAQIAAPTISEALGVPYAFVGYTPQILRSAHHTPFTVPLHDLPPAANRLLWKLFGFGIGAVFRGPLTRTRATLGLAPIVDHCDHFFPVATTLIAADPELAPLPADARRAQPITGALHLPDARPLDVPLERFLARGQTPLYLGFGSMLDDDPATTLQTIVKAAELAECRLVVSAGWAHLAGVTRGTRAIGDRVLVVGPTSHALLFPRVAGIVHHGGAGTTSAALHAGRPQLVVPHVFDQFQWARWAHEAGVGPQGFDRSALTTTRLAQGLSALMHDRRYADRATLLGDRVRARDPIRALISELERLAARPLESPSPLQDRA